MKRTKLDYGILYTLAVIISLCSLLPFVWVMMTSLKSPEQIYVEQEILRELYAGLDRIGRREQAYLLYRYGFTDDIEHTTIGAAIHFNLSESRAKKTEEQAMDNLWLELPWWF